MGSKRGISEEYALDEHQLQQLWVVCKEPDDKVLIGLMAFLGMRTSEAIHLNVSWIKEGEVHIPSSMPCTCWECSLGRGGVWHPKTKAGARIIPIPAFLKPILVKYLTTFPEGLKITRQSAWNRVRRLASEAKLPYVFPHCLRASAATLYAKKGLTAIELCQMFGWSRISIGESYIRLSEAREGVKHKMKEIWG